MAKVKKDIKIHFYKFLVVGFIILLLLNFIPSSPSSTSYTGPTNPCYFWCDGSSDDGPTINKVNSSTSRGFPFEALFTKHQTTINGVETFSSNKNIDWHNLAVDVGFVIVLDFVISSLVYLGYSSIYRKKKSTASKQGKF